MHIDTKYRLFAFIYLTVAYATVLPVTFIIIELIIGGALIDIWKGEDSFIALLAYRKIIYLKLSVVESLVGLSYWFAFYRNYKYFDPLDKYFK